MLVLAVAPHPALHPIFETLGYAAGYTLYKHNRARQGDILPEPQRWSVITAAALGALLGSRILGLVEQAPRIHLHLTQLLLPGGGKTIVGGLLGGWLAVELTKRLQGIHTRTGDLFVFPLCLGIAVGRIGCLLAGLADDTFGTPTRSPFVTRYLSIDFGDGIPRHPTQIYEILFLGALALTFHTLRRYGNPSAPRNHSGHHTPLPNGALFRLFLAAYLLWRLFIDLLKPQPLVHGLNAIQWAAAAGLLTLTPNLVFTRLHSPEHA